MRVVVRPFKVLLGSSFALAEEAKAVSPLPAKESPAAPPALVLHELRYDGKVGDDEAQFTMDITAESLLNGEATQSLFEGDLGFGFKRIEPVITVADRTAARRARARCRITRLHRMNCARRASVSRRAIGCCASRGNSSGRRNSRRTTNPPSWRN